MAWLRSLRDAIATSWYGKILAFHDTEPVELMGGVTKTLLGGWLLLPFDSFDSSPTFAALTVAPEWLWGGALLSIGVLHLFALRDGHPGWRRTAGFVGFLVWFSMAVTFVLSNPPAIGWIMFLVAAGGQGWVWVRLGRPL